MFQKTRRTLQRWGGALLAGLGLSLAAQQPSGLSYKRQRDELPKEVQNDRMIAAMQKRRRKNERRIALHRWACDNNPICRAW